MKNKFLALVEEVKATGIVAALSGASNPEELESVWNEFKGKNPDLFAKANAWGSEFKEPESSLFECEESFENPVEIAVTIVMVGNEISDADIFDDYEDLVKALEDEESDFANAIAEFLNHDYIYNITPRDFFLEDDEEDEESEDDDNQEDAETDQSDDDGETE